MLVVFIINVGGVCLLLMLAECVLLMSVMCVINAGL